MKSFNPNPLNRKRQNGSRNPFFLRSKEITPNGCQWCDPEDPEAILIDILTDSEDYI